jgi:hypothetical protein
MCVSLSFCVSIFIFWTSWQIFMKFHVDLMLLKLPKNFFSTTSNDMMAAQTCDVGAAVTTLYVGFWNNVRYWNFEMYATLVYSHVDYKITWMPWHIYLTSRLTAVTNGQLDLGMWKFL